MTLKRAFYPAPHLRRRPRLRHDESNIQQACVRWFRFQYPALAPLLFAVPNGGSRDLIEASRLKAEGVTPGVADLILLVPNGKYASLCIEMKTRTGRQSTAQKTWQRAAEEAGNRYVVCRTLDQFIETINQYLQTCPL